MKYLMSSVAPVVGRFRDNEDGATALSFALGLTVMLGAIGVGMDFSIASKANKKAQNVADMAALNAAVFVRENDDEKPGANDTDAFADNTEYAASAIGYDFGGMIVDDVKVKVTYDMSAREATAVVWGSTQTTFTSFLGHEKVPFSSQATVKFLTRQITAPASVFIVADNSGSMAWHDEPRYDVDWNEVNTDADTNGQARIVSLKASVKSFMTKLESVAGRQDTAQGDDLVLRTGLVPYSTSILPTTVDRDWGYLTDDEINAMSPKHSTNSSPPMKRVKEWMDGEEDIHVAEHKMKPLKYVVFLTDGQNTGGSDMWVASPGGGVWTGQYCEVVEKTERKTVPRNDPDAKTCRTEWFENISRASTLVKVENLETGKETYKFTWEDNLPKKAKPYNISQSYFNQRYSGGYGYNKVKEVCKGEVVTETENCTTYDAKKSNGSVDYSDVIRSVNNPNTSPDAGPSTNMTEGRFVYDFDWETVATCNALRDDGVKVFSIGFALDAGRYLSNRATYSRWGDQDYMPDQNAQEADSAFQRATQLLEQCAFENTDDFFMLASDTEGLQKAFDEIGQTISEDVVRLSR